ncbi:MAG: RHS repeat-associated core domain-containing protein [Thioploca sp.]|nr:RHS repeat-associated core domain-containing protein [Thioploca sp.]
MTYTAANRLATYNGQAVRFDADGNMTFGPVSGRMAELQFDSHNRLVQAGEIRYRYDAENQRVGVNETNYVVNSQLELSQVLVKEENGKKTFYVYGLGLIGEEGEERYRSYHFDFRGSTVALTNERGEVVERFGYGPYGELVAGEASVTPFLFNGRFGVMTDPNGLYFMRARYYSPEIKRFVNLDVLLGEVGEGQGLNRFAYGIGNPINYIDPEGRLAWWIIPLVTIGLTLYDVIVPPELPAGLEQDAIVPSIGPVDFFIGLSSGTTSLVKGVCGKLEKSSPRALKYPLDRFPFSKHPLSRRLSPGETAGEYVYIKDAKGVVHIGPNRSHMHAQLLGGGKPVTGAGTLTIDSKGVVIELTNISGNFQFSAESLIWVKKAIEKQGLRVAPEAFRSYEEIMKQSFY